MGDEQSKFEKEKDDDDDESYNQGSDSTGSALGGAIVLAGAAAAVGAGLLKLYQTYNKTENCHSYSSGRDNAEYAEPSSRIFIDYPSHWSVSKFKADEDHFCLIKCEKGSKEFQSAESLMRQSMPRVNVTSVERIENKKLYESYHIKKMQMERINGKILQKQLFHSTQIKNIDSICHQGFDLRLNGESNGTRYGKGIYFAVDAKFSDDYSEQFSGTKKMFLANVLVGNYTIGDSDHKRPPALNNTSFQLYDSCVNNIISPTIFVIFDSSQVYPEYLISYC